MNGFLPMAGGLAVVVLALGYACVLFYAGMVGASEWLGTIWAWLIGFAALFFRFTLPLTVCAFYGAWKVWDWHWALALLLAAPGIAFMIPAVIVALLGALRGAR